MDKIIKDLFELQDKKYRDFQSKLIPTVDKDTIIGVRTPELKKYAKKMIKENTYIPFISNLPHKYFEENQLHMFIISEIKDYEECLKRFNEFLPYVDNWATCDQSSPKSFIKNSNLLIKEIETWLKSKHTYTIRFGISMLMRIYLDENFNKKYLSMVSKIKSNEYYVNMMISWYFATSLAKQYKSTIPYLINNKLSVWVHNKTIQKACESYRITNEQKEYLKSLKRGIYEN